MKPRPHLQAPGTDFMAQTTDSRFDARAFVESVMAAGPRAVVAIGASARTISGHADVLGALGREVGLDLVVADCARTDHTIADAVRHRMQSLQSTTGLDAATLRLAEAVERGADESPTVRVDGLARLWARLDAHAPALLVVLHPREASDADTLALTHLARFVYSDPLATLAPEAASWTPPHGRMVIVGQPAVALEADTLDVGESTVAAIREYLGRDEVVRRFLETTQGDVTRLDELVDRLPQSPSHLALYRYETLEAYEQVIVQTLAVAGGPVAPDHLHDTVALLGASEYFARALRNLEESRLIHKSMGQGRIVVQIEDPGFGAALIDRLGAERLRAIHRAIADAEQNRNGDDADVELLAVHYAAAGDHDLAQRFGLRALARLRRERRHGAARRLAEMLVDGAAGEVRDAVEIELAGVLTDLGEFRAALDAYGRVEKRNLAVTMRRGQLLARVGEWRAATTALDEVVEGAEEPTLRRDARLARADVAYATGEHDIAVELLEGLVATLTAQTQEPSVRDRALLAARNTLGKIAIVRAQFEQAVELFSANRDLASAWGWDDEVSRAEANLGVVALQRDDHDEALQRLLGALESSDSHGSLPRAYCLMNLAAVYQRRDQYAPALEHCLDAMRCAKKVGDDTAYSVSARNLATIFQDLGAYERAQAIVDHLRDEYEGDDETLAGGWNLLVRAQLLLDTGDDEGAQACFERLRSARLAPVFGTEAALRLAELHHRLGHDERAAEELSRVDLGERTLYHGLAALLRAELALDAEEFTLALELARTAYETLEEVGEKNEPVRARLVIANALDALGRDAEARTELQRELGRLRRVSATIPAEFVASFWAKPLHRQLAQRLQALDGEVPTECLPPAPRTESRVVAMAHDADFWAWRAQYAEIVGEDPRLHHVFRLVDRVAKSDATVLAYGESGTGKELIASALHRRSNRAGKPFVKVNCAAFVDDLLLSELFGHEKGAFTGAVEQKQGRFERAHGGTIFLDEIGDISPNTQVALLRVLQEGTYERVGGTQTLNADVRVVCATNRDLEEMVRRGEFRLDLYYRLKGVVIEMPALRERREDIGRLANHFASTLAPDAGKRFSNDALQFLARYSWPGNVRELQNFVRSILLFVERPTIELDDILEFRDFFVSGDIDATLPPVNFEAILPAAREPSSPELETVEEDRAMYHHRDPADALVEKIVSEGRSLSDIKKKLEIECIRRALIETGGNVTQAADILQMKRPRLSQIISADEELSALKARLTG